MQWDLVPKSQLGGLSFGGLKIKNLPLLAKWSWRNIHDAESLWYQSLKAFMGRILIIGKLLEVWNESS